MLLFHSVKFKKPKIIKSSYLRKLIFGNIKACKQYFAMTNFLQFFCSFVKNLNENKWGI